MDTDVDSDVFNFLLSLVALLEENNATLNYTTNDDGIHIMVRGVEVFSGFIDENFRAALMEAKQDWRNV